MLFSFLTQNDLDLSKIATSLTIQKDSRLLDQSIMTKLTSSQLVKNLYNFGFEDNNSIASTSTLPIIQQPKRTKEEQIEIDELAKDQDELIVNGTKFESNSQIQEEKVIVENIKGKGKVSKSKKGKKSLLVEELASLSLEDSTNSTSNSNLKPIKSLKGLLRSTIHTITIINSINGEEIKRELTSWKMADYAYKRDPCPFPTRARGLFTEKIERVKTGTEEVIEGEGEEDEEEYRIVARGYDKFFNVGEVSWTHVSENIYFVEIYSPYLFLN